MLIKILDWGTWIVPILLIGACISLYIFRTINKSYQKILFYFLLLSLLFDLTSRYWSYVFKQNLNFISIFAILEVLIFYVFYNNLMQRHKRIRLFFTTLVIIYLGIDILFMQSKNISTFQTYSRSTSACFIVLNSMLYYIQIIKQHKVALELIQLNSVILLYYALNVILYLPINYILNVSLDVNLTLWIFKLLLLLFFYSFLWMHLWIYGKRKR